MRTYFFIPLLLAALGRLLFLDADPGIIKSLLGNATDANDEAYWALAARNLFSYGQLITNNFSHVVVSPFYTVATYFAYTLFDLSLFSTRFPNAIAGVLSVWLLYQIVKTYDIRGAFVAALVLAVENVYFTYTRIGHPEVMCSFFILLSFYFLIVHKRAFPAGLAFGLSVASKIVAVWAFPTFVLFLLCQLVRRELSRKNIYSFGIGLSLVGLCYILFVIPYLDIFINNFSLPGRSGPLLLSQPHRVIPDFFLSLYTSFPSVGLLLLFLGVYLSRVRAICLFNRDQFKNTLKHLNSADIMALAWIIGLTLSMMLLSDVHHRRMSLFTIPLSMVPGLLMRFESQRAAGVFQAPIKYSTFQAFLTMLPITLLASLLGGKFLNGLIPYSFLWVSALICFLVYEVSRHFDQYQPIFILRLKQLSFLAWIALCAAPFAQSLLLRVLPNLEIEFVYTRIAIILLWVSFVFVFSFLLNKTTVMAILVILVVNISLDVYDLSHTTYSVRNASLYVRDLTTPSDDIFGIGAHTLSMNGKANFILWYPDHGYNDPYVRKSRSGYFTIEVNKGVPPSPEDPAIEDLDNLDIERVRHIKDFDLFPLAGQPMQTVSLYELSYR